MFHYKIKIPIHHIACDGINNNDKQFSSIVIHRLKMFNAEITRVCDTHIV